ncbi:hypothetical protein [Streptomyces sp. AJS327]|uniref:hypothetical protein n=1 Tax=Streptomyces sp. AJS327 TaxID=2545265 RepID=UPI0015DD8CF2|nr:hypothetical protein [Streptomyces sp. AJS327]
MLSLTKQLGSGSPVRSCVAACGRVSGDIARVELLRKVWGVCMSLRVTLTAGCDGR